MKKTVLILALASFISGCAIIKQQRVAPAAPEFKTKNTKTLAHICQSIYSNCSGYCNVTYRSSANIVAYEQCYDDCDKELNDCYKTCE